MLLAGEFLASVGVMVFDVNQNSLSAMIMPNEVRSRVVGVSRFFNYGTRPFGALLGGVLGAWIGLRPTLWIGVVGCLLGVLFLLASPMPQHARGRPGVSRSEILRHRPLRALLVAEVISTTGAQMTWLALPWFVLTTTGSPGQMTLVMIAELIGFAAAGLLSGSFVQRLGARRSMLVADAARAPLMMLVPVLHWSGHLTLAALVLLALMLGILGAPYFTAQKVILPELIGEDERVMSQANALFQGAIRMTLLLGPPLGGVLIGVIGAAEVLVVDAATYVVSFALVAVFVPGRARVAEDEDSGGFLEGFRFLIRDRLLRLWMPLFVAGDAAWQAFFAAVPVLTIERFGADAKIAGAALRSLRGGRSRRELPLVPLLCATCRRLAPDRAHGADPGCSALAAHVRRGRRDDVRRAPHQRHGERALQSVDPLDLHASDAAGDPSRKRWRPE